MVGVEVGDSERRMSAVVSSMGPDFHNFARRLNKLYFDLIVLKVLTVDTEYCLKSLYAADVYAASFFVMKVTTV